MSVAIKKIPGVESVHVSLDTGVAEIRLKPGNKVSLAELNSTILHGGYSPRDAWVEASGRVVDGGDRKQLWVQPDEALVVRQPAADGGPLPPEELKDGETIVVRGMVVAQDPKKTIPRWIELEGIQVPAAVP